VAEEMLYAAQKTRGKVRGALPRIPARGHPLRTRRLSLPLHVSERRVHGVRPPRLNVRAASASLLRGRFSMLCSSCHDYPPGV